MITLSPPVFSLGERAVFREHRQAASQGIDATTASSTLLRSLHRLKSFGALRHSAWRARATRQPSEPSPPLDATQIEAIRADFTEGVALLQGTLAAFSCHDASSVGGLLPAVARENHPFLERFVATARNQALATPWELETFTQELFHGAAGLPTILSTLASAEDLATLTQAFSVADPDPLRWAFLSWPRAAAPDAVTRFATACRQHGITPSLILLKFFAAFLVQGHRDAAEPI